MKKTKRLAKTKVMQNLSRNMGTINTDKQIIMNSRGF